MSPGEDNQIEFKLDENIEILLDSLRKLDLAWIGDEIQDAILEDWLGVRESIVVNPAFDWKEDQTVRKVRGRGQETVALSVLRNYFVELFDVWKEAQVQLSEAIGEKRLHVELAPPGVGQPLVVFQSDYEKASSELRRILERVLPEPGTEEPL